MSAPDMVLRFQRALAHDTRHLMVSLLLRPRSVVVTSVAVAAGRPPQLLSAGHSWLAAVTRDHEVVHLSLIPDPFAWRGVTTDPDRSTLAPCHEGRAVVAVPFEAATELSRSLVHVLELGSQRIAPDRQGLSSELVRRLQTGAGVRTVDFEAITATPQWRAVAELLGPGHRPRR